MEEWRSFQQAVLGQLDTHLPNTTNSKRYLNSTLIFCESHLKLNHKSLRMPENSKILNKNIGNNLLNRGRKGFPRPDIKTGSSRK